MFYLENRFNRWWVKFKDTDYGSDRDRAIEFFGLEKSAKEFCSKANSILDRISKKIGEGLRADVCYGADDACENLYLNKERLIRLLSKRELSCITLKDNVNPSIYLFNYVG